MKTITIGFSKACTFFPIFSWLIMLTERTPYSHVYLKIKDKQTNRLVHYQASHSFCNCMGEKVFESQETKIKEFSFKVSDASFVKVKQFSIDAMGKPYGVLSILGLTWVQLLKCFGIKIQNPFRDNGRTYICSQFVATLLKTCEGIKMPENINDITPKDLYPIIEGLPKKLFNDVPKNQLPKRHRLSLKRPKRKIANNSYS